MSKSAMNLQDSYLNQVRRENSEVRVLLVNGTLLRGVVRGFDNFTLILSNRNGQHLIYKHAIAQIVSHRSPSKPEETQEDVAPAADADQQTGTPDQGAQALEGNSAEGTAAAPAPQARKPQRRRDHSQRDRAGAPKPEQPKSKKEGFNTIDLSGVKLGEK